LAVPRVETTTKKASKRSERRETGTPLFQALRRLRKELADEQGVPPYVVFSDATLKEIAERKPKSPPEMLSISGVGYAKMDRYGKLFLDAVKEFGMGS
jgi:ATP-dependent DNA helicase RecQ